MPPKRSTRSSTRASKDDDTNAESNDDVKGNATKQVTLEETGSGVIDHKTGKKRSAPSSSTVTSADDKKDGTRANKRQKEEAAQKAHLKGGADELDDKSEEAKATGRDIMDDDSVDVKKPSRGTLEKGTVYFWYKPKVETEDPENLDDVSKCHMLMLPHKEGGGNNNATPYRLLTFGRKHLPGSRDEGNHEVEWGRITAVGDDLKELKDALGPSTYETKTRGTRHQPASRCAAQGYYILRSPEANEEEGIKPIEKADKNLPRDFPVYLAYAIAIPDADNFGDVQNELKIVPRGSFAIQVKNPDAPATNPRAAGSSSSKAKEYPAELRGLFTTRFISANPVELLDYPGQELLFISGKHKDSEAVQKEVEEPAEKEGEELEEKEKKEDDEHAIFDEVFGELDLFKKAEDVPGLRALEGEWA